MKNQKSNYELSKEASEFLKNHGYGIFGEKKEETDFNQMKFEQKMMLGAYCSSNTRRK